MSLAAVLTVALDPALALLGLTRPGPVAAALFGERPRETVATLATAHPDPDFEIPGAAADALVRPMWSDPALDEEMRHVFVMELAMAEVPPTLATTEQAELPFGAQVPEPGSTVPFAVAVAAAFSRRWRGRR